MALALVSISVLFVQASQKGIRLHGPGRLMFDHVSMFEGNASLLITSNVTISGSNSYEAKQRLVHVFLCFLYPRTIKLDANIVLPMIRNHQCCHN